MLSTNMQPADYTFCPVRPLHSAVTMMTVNWFA